MIGFGDDEYGGNGGGGGGRNQGDPLGLNAVKRYGTVMPSDLALVEQLRGGPGLRPQQGLLGSGPKQFL